MYSICKIYWAFWFPFHNFAMFRKFCWTESPIQTPSDSMQKLGRSIVPANDHCKTTDSAPKLSNSTTTTFDWWNTARISVSTSVPVLKRVGATQEHSKHEQCNDSRRISRAQVTSTNQYATHANAKNYLLPARLRDRRVEMFGPRSQVLQFKPRSIEWDGSVCLNSPTQKTKTTRMTHNSAWVCHCAVIG